MGRSVCSVPFEGTEGSCGPFVFRRDHSRRHVARPPLARSIDRSTAKATEGNPTRTLGPTRVWRDAAAILKPPATPARETRKLCTPYLHTHVAQPLEVCVQSANHAAHPAGKPRSACEAAAAKWSAAPGRRSDGWLRAGRPRGREHGSWGEKGGLSAETCLKRAT